MGIALSLIMLFTGPCAFGEDGKKTETRPLYKEAGFIAGYGTGSIHEGNYEPVLLIAHLAYDLKAFFPSLDKHRGILSVVCEPQINPVFQPKSDIEFGVGLGLKYMYPATDNLYPYIQGTVGPHYISVQTDDQASGFTFADTIGAGLYYFVTKTTAVNAGYRFRHMSNAGIKSPNGGINTHFGTAGVSLFF
jgi:hypothetical protein